MWLAAARRFGLLLAGVAGGVALLGLVGGALAGYSIARAMAVSFYVVGVALLVVGFFSASRGPVRTRDGESFRYGAQVVRWATRGEQNEVINFSAILVVLGLLLIVIGVAVDSQRTLA